MVDIVKRILAAGTVTVRVNEGVTEVLLVHRPRYDDWTIPKGKLDPGESLPVCAVRETEEESSVSTRLGLPITEITYPIGSGVKAVSYWRGTPLKVRKHKPNSEVDQVGWFSVTSALRQVSYADEREVLRQAINLPATTPLVILRHAKALARSEWSGGPDSRRGLEERGERQSQEVGGLLAAYGVARVVTSSATRCVRTVRPYAKAAGLAVDRRSELTEESGLPNPKAVTASIRLLAEQTAAQAVPTVVCGHRPVLPAMLAGLGISAPQLAPASALVAHLDSRAQVVALELHKSLL